MSCEIKIDDLRTVATQMAALGNQVLELLNSVPRNERFVISESIPAGGTLRDRLKLIALRVGDYYGRNSKDICGQCRVREIVWPRMVFYWAARELTPASLEQVGEFCGGRDHTTVAHGVKNVVEQRELYRDMRTETDLVLRKTEDFLINPHKNRLQNPFRMFELQENLLHATRRQ